jgi:hypothetical protein
MKFSESCPLCKSAGSQVLCELKYGISMRLYWHCLSCDLVFLDPKQRYDSASEKKHYSFHQNSIHDEKYCEFLKKLITPLLQKVEQESGPLAIGLDYGSGPSPVLAELVRKVGHQMEIFDPYFANNRAVLGRKYDFATCCEVVEHMYNPHAGFLQLDAVLKQGGVLGVMTGMIADWSKFSSWHYPQEATHVCFYSSNTMAWLAHFFNWRLLSVAGNVTIFQKN